IFNIAYEKETTILDLAKQIKKTLKSTSKIKKINADKKRFDFEVERRIGSSDKLYKFIKYKPDTNFNEGLKLLLKNYK
ncbi:MAG: hypothetical protein ACMXX8_00375, partial [Candidatus Woesearchaeota archaeon]